jgi:hypothetical protein
MGIKLLEKKDEIRGQFHQHPACSFHWRRTQKHKKYSKVISVFALFGSVCIKAACKTLVKLTPGNVVKGKRVRKRYNQYNDNDNHFVNYLIMVFAVLIIDVDWWVSFK